MHRQYGSLVPIELAPDVPATLVIGYKAAVDPEIRSDHADTGGSYIGNRSHLAWSTGPHTCPAKSVAYLTVQYAIDTLLDALPEM